MATGNSSVGVAIGTVSGMQQGYNSYKAAKANTKETIETCVEQRDSIFKDLKIADINEAEINIEIKAKTRKSFFILHYHQV